MSHPQPAVLPAEKAEEWQPHAPEEFQEVGAVGRIAIGLLGASTITHLLSTWSDWNTYGVVHRYLGGEVNVGDDDLNRADSLARLTSIPNVIVSVAAAVVFVIWLWRSRVNSEVLCQADHRHSHGWVLASWFCPGPNLWYPKQIVDDVWLASDPRTPVWSDDLRRLRRPLLTSVWWCTWVGALAFDVVIRRVLMWMDPTVTTLRGIALAGTASLVLTFISAVAATLVIYKITRMQTSREWIPWWDQREPQLTSVKTGRKAESSRSRSAAQDPEATMVAPPLRLERQPELQYAGAAAGSEQQWAAAGQTASAHTASAQTASAQTSSAHNAAAQTARLSAVPSQSPLQAPPLNSGGSPLAPAAGLGSPYAGDADAPYSWPSRQEPKEEPAASWSPFASVVESWQDPADAAPETQQFSPYDAWRAETGPVKEAPASLQPSASPEPPQPTWSTSASRYSSSDDLLSAPRPSWQAETVAPPSLSVVPPAPAEPEVPSWRKSFEEYRTGQTPSPYLSSSAPTATSEPAPAPTPTPAPAPAPAPEPAPAVRPGRRAARVAVDSPSAVRAPQSPPDDYLTPSKPLPPVPSFGPEPAYQPEPSYQPEPTYNSEPAYRPEPSYPQEPYSSRTSYSAAAESTYSAPESTYRAPEQTYSPPEPTYQPESTYKPEPTYSRPEPTYQPEPPAYQPESTYQSYRPEPTYQPEPTYSQPEPTSYQPEPTYPAEPYQYSPEPSTNYGSESGYSSTYDSYSSPQSSYDQYNSPSSYESSYSPEPPASTYSQPEPTYTPEPSYQAYTPEPAYAPESTYSTSQYGASHPAQAPQPEPQPAAEPTTPQARDAHSASNGRDDADTTAPRTHPRRRWV